MRVVGKVARMAAMGIVFAAASGPAALADVRVTPPPVFTPCAETGQPALTNLVAEPGPVPGGRAGFVRFTATFNRVVPTTERVCFRMTVSGAGLRVRGGDASSVTFYVTGQGSNTINFAEGGQARTAGAGAPRGVRTTLMATAGVGTINLQQVNSFGVGLVGSTVRTVQVQVGATPAPVLTITRPALLVGQVGVGTIALPFTLAEDLVLETRLFGQGFNLDLRPATGGTYSSVYTYRVANSVPNSAQFYYKPLSTVTQSQLVSFASQYILTTSTPSTVLTSPQVTVSPVPNCGSRGPILQRQPDGSFAPDCKKATIQPLPFKN